MSFTLTAEYRITCIADTDHLRSCELHRGIPTGAVLSQYFHSLQAIQGHANVFRLFIKSKDTHLLPLCGKISAATANEKRA